MLGALSTTTRPFAWANCCIVELEEIVKAPSSCVIVEVSYTHLLVIVLKLHEDDTVSFVVGEASLGLELFSPELTVIAPTTCEGVLTVRVSHLDKSHSIAQSNDAESGKGMVVEETILVFVCFCRLVTGGTLHDVAILIML